MQHNYSPAHQLEQARAARYLINFPQKRAMDQLQYTLMRLRLEQLKLFVEHKMKLKRSQKGSDMFENS